MATRFIAIILTSGGATLSERPFSRPGFSALYTRRPSAAHTSSVFVESGLRTNLLNPLAAFTKLEESMNEEDVDTIDGCHVEIETETADEELPVTEGGVA